MSKEDRQARLLATLLGDMGDALSGIEKDDDCDCGTLWIPEFRYEPHFEFDEEDIQTIREMAEMYPECEAFLDYIDGRDYE